MVGFELHAESLMVQDSLIAANHSELLELLSYSKYAPNNTLIFDTVERIDVY